MRRMLTLYVDNDEDEKKVTDVLPRLKLGMWDEASDDVLVVRSLDWDGEWESCKDDA